MAMYLMPDVTSMNRFHIDGQRDRGLVLPGLFFRAMCGLRLSLQINHGPPEPRH